MFKKIFFRRLVYLLILGVFTVVVAVACNSTSSDTITTAQKPTENCRVVQHALGETCIPQNPQRVITLFTPTLANSLALGVRPIASTYITGFPLAEYLEGKVNEVESVGGVNDPNLEKILELKPDLILCTSRLEGIYQQLSHIAPTAALSLPFPPPSWKEQLEELAQVLDKEDVSQQLISDYWQRITALKQSLGDRRHTLKVSVANISSEYGIWAYGEKHFSGMVLSDIGLQRPLAQQGDFFYIENISQEKMIDIDGDVLFFVSWGRDDDKKTLEKLQKNPLWKQLKVVQENKVYFVDGHWHGSDIFAINAILDDLEKHLVDTP